TVCASTSPHSCSRPSMIPACSRCDHVGPPQLPHQEQQQERPERQQQLPEDPDDPAPTATRAMGGAHPVTSASRVREPTKPGSVVVSRVSICSPSPTWSTHSR